MNTYYIDNKILDTFFHYSLYLLRLGFDVIEVEPITASHSSLDIVSTYD